MIVLVGNKQIAVVGGLISISEAVSMLLDDVSESDVTLKFSDFTEVRQAREPLLKSADDLINAAEDKSVDVTPFRQYRQALRDIPQTFNDAQDVVWPTKPSLSQASV
ncbi:phage tail assembly chaperone [Moritella sp.]|uniref:phage tail assembly chaperone n=1 Tax=Moritella sp. TaxID=78556 RepID=UPI0025E0DC7A|nr:phage tail assembly chaperone [Moritella sp.]MCJ8350727.1 phage tail assembly chaperone [Moritella sp.]